MGVYAAHLVPLVAEAMRLLGVRHAFVVHGAVGRSESAATSGLAGMDELSISGPSQIAEVRGDTVTFAQLTPEEVGLHSAPIESLYGGGATSNAHILRDIFAGEPGPRRDVVLLNTAAVLITAGIVPSFASNLHATFREAIQLAAAAIDTGAVTDLVARLSAT